MVVAFGGSRCPVSEILAITPLRYSLPYQRPLQHQELRNPAIMNMIRSMSSGPALGYNPAKRQMLAFSSSKKMQSHEKTCTILESLYRKTP